MWVFSRRVGEGLQIGDEITVEVKRITGDRVTFVIDTPRDARVTRGEHAGDGDASPLDAENSRDFPRLH